MIHTLCRMKFVNIFTLKCFSDFLNATSQSIRPCTTGAGSAAKDILDLDRETVLEIIGPGDQSGEDEFPYTSLQLRPS